MLTALIAMVVVGEGVVVRGVVRDPSGLPVPSALVYVKGSQLQTTTDDQGSYALRITLPPPVTLVAFQGGFQPREVELTQLAEGASVDLSLALAPVTDRVTVRSQSHPAPASGVQLGPLDVVRTPGTQADVFRTVQTLPGVVAVDEGAGLYVRGGDVGETGVFLDGVPLAHPYRYESPTGGWFGSVEPFLLEGMAFTSAGFPARFGGVLGAVLDLKGLGQPTARQLQLTAGLAGLSGKLALPLGSQGGLRVSGNRTLTNVLFAINGAPRRFDINPNGWDLSLSAHHASPSLGAFKLTGFAQGDQVGVELEQDAFVGFLHSRTHQRFASGHWARSLGSSWQLTAAAGRDGYRKTSDVGALRVRLDDGVWSGRVDAEGSASGASLRLGVDGARVRSRMSGHKPVEGGDFGGLQGAYSFDLDHGDWRLGAYAEAERPLGRWLPTVGLRLERFDRSGETSAAPRLGARFRIAGPHVLVMAWGLYRQAPAPGFFDPYFGAERLAALRSEHRVVGYEWGSADSATLVRLEAYDKHYQRLPLYDGERLTSSGYGTARGLDLFARRAFSRGELRANYSWLRARRRSTPLEEVNRFPPPEGTWPPDFDIPHSAQVVGTWRPTSALSLGIGGRVASGRPDTPILGRAPDGGPAFGAINSERLPAYARLDLSASYSRQALGHGLLIAFAGVTNALARPNAFQYAYSSDYQTRRLVTSAAPRSFYVGASLTR